MNRRLNRLIAPFQTAALLLSLLFINPAHAQDKSNMQNVLNLDATVSAPITPDTAVITLFAERSGADASAITQEINTLMADALREAKANAGVQATTGNFSTHPQHDQKGVQTGWHVRSELILKSKDFGVLGKLAGGVSKKLRISSNGFEVSRELKKQEEDKLLQLGLEAFQNKAKLSCKALGFGGYSIREVSLQQANVEGNYNPRPMMAMARGGAMAMSADVPMEAGATSISLTVRGSVVMK